MRHEAKTYLFDIARAGEMIASFLEGKTLSDYAADPMLRSAVERQFEIIGEALAKLAKHHPDIAAGITDHQRIIAFRNILIHGYADIDDRLVFDIAASKLPVLRQEAARLLDRD